MRPRAEQVAGRVWSRPDVAGWPLVPYPRTDGPAVPDRIVGACRRVGFRARVAQACGDVHATMGLVGAGVGIALAIGTEYARTTRGVIQRTLDDPVPIWTLALAWRRDDASP